MSNKKSFSTAPKPQTQPSLETISAFEQGGAGHDAKPITANTPAREKKVPKAVDEPLKRISIDLPASLHKRFKTACSATDTKMTTEMLRLIERRTTELEKKVSTA